jgi:hypothetical protein
MSGLLDALSEAGAINPRAAAEAVAAWLDGVRDASLSPNTRASLGNIITLLREEVAPPKPTPEDVIREAMGTWQGRTSVAVWEYVAAALRDAGMLKDPAVIEASPDPDAYTYGRKDTP